ncbi:hypothetical protein [Nocardioides panzhihuensis]|uniref:Uncharacterized protein n=1 Tax=Nocardioides panzhihuensis TaxID=860243 RepID=A0A7Z0ITR6_9ACTN|nr:hypothetical protein [Nocardioides panzhihuensis]NYI79429.1 hypothetical protein [Nocardioides panzhihuensis]
MGPEVPLTEDTFRALARSSPWRFSSLHFTWRTQSYGDVECWLRRPGRLRVRDGSGDRVIDDAATTDPAPAPVLRADGLVASRPRAYTHDIDDPMWNTYWFVSMLDPEELSADVTLSELRSGLRAGRETWWARAVPEAGYEPRCGCCPLLWSRVTDWAEYGDDEPGWEPPAGTVYPEAYEVALDVLTGVVVQLSPVGGSRPDLAFETEIHEAELSVVSA